MSSQVQSLITTLLFLLAGDWLVGLAFVPHNQSIDNTSINTYFVLVIT